MRITFKKPSKYRATYAIIVDGATIADPRLDAINKDLRRGEPPDTLEIRIKSLIATLRGTPAGPTLSDLNRSVVEQRHANKLLRNKGLRDEKGLKQRLMRAATWLGDLSLREASEDELIARLNEASEKSRFELTRATNELLKFAGRPLLPMPRKEHATVKYVAEAEFVAGLSKLPSPEKLYIAALFGTGCRFSELPLAVFHRGMVIVKHAYGSRGKSWGKIQGTKNKHEREALVLPPFVSYVREFCALPAEEKKRLWSRHKELLRLCRATYSRTLHDLRHSYCVALGSKGYPVGKVAGYIGDGEAVTRRYYLGYFVSEDEVADAARRWA